MRPDVPQGTPGSPRLPEAPGSSPNVPDACQLGRKWTWFADPFIQLEDSEKDSLLLHLNLFGFRVLHPRMQIIVCSSLLRLGLLDFKEESVSFSSDLLSSIEKNG